MERIQLHPMFDDPIESDRCPVCGTPGRVLEPSDGFVILMGCPACEPHLFEGVADADPDDQA